MNTPLLLATTLLVWVYIVYLIMQSSTPILVDETETENDCSKCGWELVDQCKNPDGSRKQSCDNAMAFTCTGSTADSKMCSPQLCSNWPPKGCSDGHYVGTCSYVPASGTNSITEYATSKSTCESHPCRTVTVTDSGGTYSDEICPTFNEYGWLRNQHEVSL